MRSAAAAFAWEFQRRLRWGLIALGLYFVVLASFQFLILGPRSPIHPLHSMTFAFTGPCRWRSPSCTSWPCSATAWPAT